MTEKKKDFCFFVQDRDWNKFLTYNAKIEIFHSWMKAIKKIQHMRIYLNTRNFLRQVQKDLHKKMIMLKIFWKNTSA